MPRSVVIDPAFSWGADRRPRTPWHRTAIYELHVKGFTARHSDVPRPLRGTYAGLAAPAAVEYLTRLGITAVELLPVHYSVVDRHLLSAGSRTTGATIRSDFSPPTLDSPPRVGWVTSRRVQDHGENPP